MCRVPFTQVGTILANHVMYGVLLGRNSSNLENCMRELVKQEEFNLFQLLADYTGATQVGYLFPFPTVLN